MRPPAAPPHSVLSISRNTVTGPQPYAGINDLQGWPVLFPRPLNQVLLLILSAESSLARINSNHTKTRIQ